MVREYIGLRQSLLYLLVLMWLTALVPVMAADEEAPAEGDEPVVEEYAYYGFDPDIVTNYITNRKKLGYVRITVELMVRNADDLIEIEHHDPLLRSAMLEILGNQEEEQVKSITGREQIRRECYDTINRLLKQETGKAMVVNLLFTRYLYD